MKLYSKLILAILLLFLFVSVKAQFYKTEHENLLVFEEDEKFSKNFGTSRSLWKFIYLNEKYLIFVEDEFINKNTMSVVLYEDFKFKRIYSFSYDIQANKAAYFEDAVYFPVTNVDNSWNILCKLNLKTDEISYIQLPETYRSMPSNDYYLDYFSFDPSTNNAHFFVFNSSAAYSKIKNVYSYDLQTGQFSQSSLDVYQHLFTLDSYHYYWDQSWNLYSKKLDDASSKPKKLPLKGDLYYPVKLSATEMLCFNPESSKTISYPNTDHEKYVVFKNGELMLDKEGVYKNVFNTLRGRVDLNEFHFEYADASGYRKKYSTTSKIFDRYFLTADLFLLVTIPNVSVPIDEDSENYAVETTFEEEFENAVVEFFEVEAMENNITNNPDSWFGKCLAFEKCLQEKAYAYFECQEIKNEVSKINLDSKLSTCEYLLNKLTNTNKEYLMIRYGTTDYENLKNELIYVKSAIIRVQNKL